MPKKKHAREVPGVPAVHFKWWEHVFYDWTGVLPRSVCKRILAAVPPRKVF